MVENRERECVLYTSFYDAIFTRSEEKVLAAETVYKCAPHSFSSGMNTCGSIVATQRKIWCPDDR